MDSARTGNGNNEARELYARKADTYVRFVSTFRHQQGLEALFARSGLLQKEMRVLDAGCGTGLSTLALIQALHRRDRTWQSIHGFDFTPAMLERFRANLRRLSIGGVELREADARRLDLLPEEWTGYDLIVSISMLEYVSRSELVRVLKTLRARLNSGGTFIAALTRKNMMTWAVIGKWWRANRYLQLEVADAFAAAGFAKIQFRAYPCPYFWLTSYNHVVFASG